MAGYFSSFPKLVYTFDKNSANQQLVTNILARSTFIESVSKNTGIFFRYSIKDSDTPEIIAHKIYGDPYRSWVVLLFNQILDPNYEWAMKEGVLDKFIEKKYDQTITIAKNTIHHYTLNINKKVTLGGTTFSEVEEEYRVSATDYNFGTGVLQNRVVPVVADTSTSPTTEAVTLTGGKILTITSKVTAVSNYSYEFEENEKRREIRLLDPIYVPQVEREFRALMSNV